MTIITQAKARLDAAIFWVNDSLRPKAHWEPVRHDEYEENERRYNELMAAKEEYETLSTGGSSNGQ